MRAIGVIWLMCIALVGQSQSLISDLIRSYEHATPAAQLEQKLSSHLTDLKKKQGKALNETEFLAEVFDFTHRKMLRSYVPYSQFNELIERGRYDCLSATALFSVIFRELGFSYRIKETNYHIFVMVQTAQGPILIETTDRFNGFVTEAEKISARLESYQQNQLMGASKNFYLYQASIYKEVSASELIGLLYFNQAVRLYNDRNYLLCAEKLDEAIARYENPRAEELAVIVLHSIQASNLSEGIKSQVSNRYQKYLSKVRPVLASR